MGCLAGVFGCLWVVFLRDWSGLGLCFEGLVRSWPGGLGRSGVVGLGVFSWLKSLICEKKE